MTREKAIITLEDYLDYWKKISDEEAFPIDDDIEALSKAIEALQEQKTGKWIYHPERKNIYGGMCIECSECGEKYMVMYIEDEKYCRNCGSYNGARMECEEE